MELSIENCVFHLLIFRLSYQFQTFHGRFRGQTSLVFFFTSVKMASGQFAIFWLLIYKIYSSKIEVHVWIEGRNCGSPGAQVLLA